MELIENNIMKVIAMLLTKIIYRSTKTKFRVIIKHKALHFFQELKILIDLITAIQYLNQ